MLFNSYVFALAFLPTTLIVFFLLGRRGATRAAMTWLVLASLFFYAWWDPAYLVLIVASVVANFLVGVRLSVANSETTKSWLLALGVSANLAALAYFKYANFLVHNLNSAFEAGLALDTVVLPLAISFFTFQQIAYLVDVRRGATREHRFLHYCLFVVFFPQFIAGPIVHHREVLPQFAKPRAFSPSARHLSIGVTIFALGLFKKVVIADTIALDATPVFDAAERGEQLCLVEAWMGTLAYSFQLYFDFSAYSDMAIGLARMFGIRLPLNFQAPYRATNVIDFWKRWHMTLSRFLRDYLYIPLGGNRKGKLRRYVNLMVTMLLGGLWHGAGWNFVVWGGLHGLYLVVNRLWRTVAPWWPRWGRPSQALSWLVTFVAVVAAWVPFRAANFDTALFMWRAMLGEHGTLERQAGNARFLQAEGLWHLGLLLFVCLVFPTTQDYMARYRPALRVYRRAPRSTRVALFTWRPTPLPALIILSLFITSLAMMERPSEFLYFRF